MLVASLGAMGILTAHACVHAVVPAHQGESDQCSLCHATMTCIQAPEHPSAPEPIREVPAPMGAVTSPQRLLAFAVHLAVVQVTTDPPHRLYSMMPMV